MQTIKVLTVADLHQLRALYSQLRVRMQAHPWETEALR